MDILVGYTGFVGGNLYSSHSFDAVYNSKNIKEAYGTAPDLLVYCGVKAVKYIANQNPEDDLEHIHETIENIKAIDAKKLILISTIDVYPSPNKRSEDFENTVESHPEAYGRHRLMLEKWVEENIQDYHIVRLPGLFGSGIKKNFIYDMIHIIPSKLTSDKMQSLNAHNDEIIKCYHLTSDGFYSLNTLTVSERSTLKEHFLKIGFSALNFTDSRAVFQFYPLSQLFIHLQTIIDKNIRVINMATEPVQISELYSKVYEKPFSNILSGKIPHYDFWTTNAVHFGKEGHYILEKEDIINAIVDFIKSESRGKA